MPPLPHGFVCLWCDSGCVGCGIADFRDHLPDVPVSTTPSSVRDASVFFLGNGNSYKLRISYHHQIPCHFFVGRIVGHIGRRVYSIKKHIMVDRLHNLIHDW